MIYCFAPPDGNDGFNITATFSETVFVDTTLGTPTFTIQIKNDNREATYTTGTDNSTALNFLHTIISDQVEDDDDSGILIFGDSLDLKNGTIKDAAGNDATITHSSSANVAWGVK